MTPDDLHKALSCLLGLPLRAVGRVVGLVWLSFGASHEQQMHNGRTRVVGDWALHLSCPWRFVHCDTIVLASGDLYCAPEGDDPCDLNAGQESRFDRLAVALNDGCTARTRIASSLRVDRVGGFSLSFQDGCAFDVFPDETRCGPDIEYWRLFRPGNDSPHFVWPTGIE